MIRSQCVVSTVVDLCYSSDGKTDRSGSIYLVDNIVDTSVKYHQRIYMHIFIFIITFNFSVSQKLSIIDY